MNLQHLSGVQWWYWVLQQARQLAQRTDRQTRGWNKGVLEMQHALSMSSQTCLSPLAQRTLQDKSVSYDTAQQGHRALTRREKDNIQHVEVLQMLRMWLSGRDLSERTRKTAGKGQSRC